MIIEHKIRKNYRLFVFLFLVLIVCNVQASDADRLSQQKQDSLLHALSNTNRAKEKIKILESLAILNSQETDEPTYWLQMIEIANKADTLECSYYAMTKLGKYYAIKKDVDGLRYWTNKLDSIGKIDPRAIESQFQVYNYLCRVYMSDGELEAAMSVAISQRLLVDRTGNKTGQTLSSENLGLIYMLTGRYKDAILMLETCLSYLNEDEGQFDFKLQVAESLVRTYIYQSEFEKGENLLEYYEKILNAVELNEGNKYDHYDSRYSRCFLYSYRIWLYSLQGQRQKALESINALAPYKDALYGFGDAINKFAMAHYSFLMQEYDKALSIIQPLEEGDNEVLRLKVDILKKKGDKMQVLSTYAKLLEVYKANNITAYTKQVDQLHSLRHLNEQEKQNQILLNQNLELKNKFTQLVMMIIFSVVLIIILILLTRYSLRLRGLKNMLELDKKSLKETNGNLEIARIKAEQAVRLKSNFVANISHEIRTPLNAIVGFSDLLRDADSEERSEYINVINNNSDLLLNLINDVLNLSRLEDSEFTLNDQQVVLQECCRHAVAAVEHRIVPGVQMKFTHPETPVLMNTDPLRLQQLLTNLLTNAAKFTDEGEIVLNLETDTAARKVIFTVTDTGCGIPLDKQQLIFNRFEKIDDFKQGAGLGLPISKVIAERLGGQLFVDPSYTTGARFVLVLPVA